MERLPEATLVLIPVGGFINQVTGLGDHAPMTRLHTTYQTCSFAGRIQMWLMLRWILYKTVVGCIQQFNLLVDKTLEGLCDRGLYTQKSDLLDQLMEDLERLGSLEVLNASPFEMISMHVDCTDGAM